MLDDAIAICRAIICVFLVLLFLLVLWLIFLAGNDVLLVVRVDGLREVHFEWLVLLDAGHRLWFFGLAAPHLVVLEHV